MQYHIVDDKVVRGQHPLVPEDFDTLRSLGINTLLNLERGWFEWFHGRMNWEVDTALDRGMAPLHIQVGAILPPSKEELVAAAVKVMADPKFGRVYVHCKDGVDRTGQSVALYQTLYHGMTPDAAIQEMYEMGYHRFMYFWWIPHLRKVMAEAKS